MNSGMTDLAASVWATDGTGTFALLVANHLRSVPITSAKMQRPTWLWRTPQMTP